MAGIMLGLRRGEGVLVVRGNEPNVLTGASDYTVPVDADACGLPYLEPEIRQDRTADAAGQHAWAARLARLLSQAWGCYA